MSTIDSPVPPGAPRPATRSARLDGGKHILILDDDATLVFLVKEMLERRGYRVSGHTNQQEALVALKTDPASFDLLITDYNMPGMSGVAVAREARSIRANLPVAVASGSITEELKQDATGSGVRELISKGIELEALCATIERLANTLKSRQDAS